MSDRDPHRRDRSKARRDPEQGGPSPLELLHGEGLGTTAAAPRIRLRAAFRRDPALRRRLLLALAAAEEDLMRQYADAAVAFVRETSHEIAFDRALAIFMRLVGVPRRDQRPLAVRALSVLEHELPDVALHADADGGPVDRILRRLRGRHRDELRARMRSAGERARRAGLQAHLHNVDRIDDALRGALPRAEAVQYYLEALDVGPGWAARIFHHALDRSDAA